MRISLGPETLGPSVLKILVLPDSPTTDHPQWALLLILNPHAQLLSQHPYNSCPFSNQLGQGIGGRASVP